MEADETIRLTVPYANKQITVQDDDEDDVTLTVGSVDITLQDTGEGGAPSFATDAAIADQTYAVDVQQLLIGCCRRHRAATAS